MVETSFPRLLLAASATALLISGCTPRQSADTASVRDTRSGAASQAATGPVTLQNGIRDYGDYQAAIARQGETVGELAARVGLSGVELGAYNGLPPNHVLGAEDELVLPPRPGGYTEEAAPAPVVAPPPEVAAIESAPLDLGAGTEIAGTPEAPSPPTAEGAWSPEFAEAAIQRATGINPDGSLAAPPSANAPLPENPADPDPLESPDLSQYQSARPPAPETDLAETAALSPETTPAPQQSPLSAGQDVTPPVEATAPQPAPLPAPAAEGAAPDLAGSDPAASAPALAQTTRLQRPVDGPIALGFQRGSGTSRNDGVDFATPAGAPVVAADDGEVALVSQSLGGLGTIVLLRHQGDLLTVYGRITDVTLKKGELVRRGQRIGSVAAPPSGSEARMHFEVRRGAESLDPRRFIAG